MPARRSAVSSTATPTAQIAYHDQLAERRIRRTRAPDRETALGPRCHRRELARPEHPAEGATAERRETAGGV
jgi:hypothetical protein